MSENGTKQKKSDKTDNYVTTCRAGAVAANVFRRTAPGGFEYLDFSLSRAWKTANGKEGYSQNFFAKNSDAIHTVVDEACAFIAKATVEASTKSADDSPQIPEAA